MKDKEYHQTIDEIDASDLEQETKDKLKEVFTKIFRREEDF